MRGYPVFRVPTEAPGPTSGEVVNPQVGPIFDASLGYLIFLLGSRRRSHHQYETSTTNVKTSTTGPWEVPELKFRERPPST
jgi:hypothetical protein